MDREETKDGEVTITDFGNARGAYVDRYVGKWI